MGVSCALYLITSEAFSAASRGDLEGFDTEDSHVDLDKAFHAISYLVTGDPDLDFLKGGVQLPDVSEHCEAHSPASIAELGTRLRAASVDSLLAGFNADEFSTNKIYPGGWDESGAQYVRPYLDLFVGFVHRAADEKKGIFVVLA